MASAAMDDRRAIDPRCLRFDQDGLLPVLVQDITSGAVLFLTHLDRQAVGRILDGTGVVVQDGDATPLDVAELIAAEDGKALLARAFVPGSDGQITARGRFKPQPAQLELGWLIRVLDKRRTGDPQASYTARLMQTGIERIAQKVGEEATETVIAAVRRHGHGDHERRAEVVAESADLLYHLLMLWLACGVSARDVGDELAKRRTSSPWEQDD